MSDREAFIRAILDHPGDDRPRLVFADFLEERGEPNATPLRDNSGTLHLCKVGNNCHVSWRANPDLFLGSVARPWPACAYCGLDYWAMWMNWNYRPPEWLCWYCFRRRMHEDVIAVRERPRGGRTGRRTRTTVTEL